tara:strand:+ start:2234 stop:2443 length:210 start_codon:yes stop_codon:yes gene_type:complete
MNVNPGVLAYTNLIIDDKETKPKRVNTSSGLLSRSKNKSMDKKDNNEPADVIKDYVSTIRKQRKKMNNG